jgi:hypothetical protein
VPSTRILAERDAGQNTKSANLLEGGVMPFRIHTFSFTFPELDRRIGPKYANYS